MGLFDAIERLNTTEEQPLSPRPRVQRLPRPVTIATLPQKKPPKDHKQPDTRDHDSWTPSPEDIEERRRILNRKPEPLSFLAPCPVCHGRAFLHIDGGGFVCRACTPGLFGYPVEATGPEQQEQPQDIDLLTAKENEHAPATLDTGRNHPTEEQLAHFAAAWPWIKENKASLMESGWTMSALVRRSRLRWPCGLWGIAWLSVWSKPGVVVSIGRRGEIVFVFSSGGRTVTQTAARS